MTDFVVGGRGLESAAAEEAGSQRSDSSDA